MNFSAKYRSRASSCEIYETIQAREFKEARNCAMKNPWVLRGIWEFVGFEDPDANDSADVIESGGEDEPAAPRWYDSPVIRLAARMGVIGTAVIVITMAIALFALNYG